MKRRLSIISTLLGGAASAAAGTSMAAGAVGAGPLHTPPPEPAAKHLNVLLVIVDDMKPVLGCYGDKTAITPNIDALAASGSVFTSAYCQQALSGPTRVSLLTGLRPDNTLIWSMPKQMRQYYPSILTMPQYFRHGGYTTAAIGKVFDPRTVDDGHDSISWSIPYIALRPYLNPAVQATGKDVPNYYNKYDKDGKNGHPSTECADVPYDCYRDGAVANGAIATIARLSKSEKPFFFAVGFSKPHLPFVAPKKYWDMYDRNKVPLAEFTGKAKNSPEIAYHGDYMEILSYTDIPPLYTFSDVHRNNGMIDIDKQRELIHGYYACVSYIDDMVGKVIGALKENGLYDNTIIVLVGDHGWHLGDHGLWAKATNFEQATRVAMIIHNPSMHNVAKCEKMAEFVDIFPTLTAMAGLPQAPNMDGIDLSATMRSPSGTTKPYAVSQFYRDKGGLNAMGYSVRTGRYRYNVWFKDNYRAWSPYDESLVVGTELYDYAKDPLETVSVAGQKEYHDVEQKMKGYLLDFISREMKANKIHLRLRPNDLFFS